MIIKNSKEQRKKNETYENENRKNSENVSEPSHLPTFEWKWKLQKIKNKSHLPTFEWK